jgi:hypothetical protein
MRATAYLNIDSVISWCGFSDAEDNQSLNLTDTLLQDSMTSEVHFRALRLPSSWQT